MQDLQAGEQQQNSHGGRQKPRTLKKTWGIFYTPELLIHHLTNWAIQSATDSILEPSFGGCGFLDACAARLAEFGAQRPWKQMAGCDIDSRAFSNLPEKYRDPQKQQRFLQANFLETNPTDYPFERFSVVIGNPPYVSRHNMRQYQLTTARAAAAAQNVKVSMRASLWAYFVIHSLAFLKNGGRMAWVLPRSLSQGDYGKKIVEVLSTKFGRIDILCLGDRAFIGVGAEEFVDILLCEDYKDSEASPNRIGIHHLAKTPPIGESFLPKPDDQDSPSRSSREQALSTGQTEAIKTLHSITTPVKMGHFADARIGLVTGAVDFFVLRRNELEANALTEEQCRFIVTKFNLTQGLDLDANDKEALLARNARVLLVDAKNPTTEKYWEKFPAERVKTVKTFKKRSQWRDPDDGLVPDAFFPPLIHHFPRIVLNTVSANCTNTVHRVIFKKDVGTSLRSALAVSLLCTQTQISCEFAGRQCGSGGLKIEPSDFAKIEVPSFTKLHLDSAASFGKLINAALRRSNLDEASELADEWLYGGYDDGPSIETLTEARAALQCLQELRFRK